MPRKAGWSRIDHSLFAAAVAAAGTSQSRATAGILGV